MKLTTRALAEMPQKAPKKADKWTPLLEALGALNGSHALFVEPYSPGHGRPCTVRGLRVALAALAKKQGLSVKLASDEQGVWIAHLVDPRSAQAGRVGIADSRPLVPSR